MGKRIGERSQRKMLGRTIDLTKGMNTRGSTMKLTFQQRSKEIEGWGPRDITDRT